MEKLIEIYIELHITDHIATTTGQNYIEIKKKYKKMGYDSLVLFFYHSICNV